MMAAAQAAAEAAMREAVNRERAGNNQTQQHADIINLLQMQAQVGGDQSSAAQQQLFHDMIGFGGFVDYGDSNVESLLEMMAQHQQLNQTEDVRDQSELEPQIRERPSTHYMTVAEDGTILEATKMITGYPPEAMLMSSWYDSVYEDDLPGFVAVKTQFWDNNRPEVECFLRRRTREGDWIWLVTKVVSYIHNPIEAVIVEEREVDDVEHAINMSRIVRVTAILVQAVQAARRAVERKKAEKMLLDAVTSNGSTRGNPRSALLEQNIPLVAEDALAYRAWMRNAKEQSDLRLTIDSDPLQSIMMAAVAGVQSEPRPDEVYVDDPIATLKKELMNENASEERKGFDPLSALKEVRGDGTRVDLGMIDLSLDEVKMVVLVLTGKLQVEELAPLVHTALNSPGQSLSTVLSMYSLNTKKQVQTPPHAAHGGRQNSSSSRSRKKTRQSAHHSSSSASLGLSGTPGRTQLHRTSSAPDRINLPSLAPRSKFHPAAISVVSLSYSNMGNDGMELLGEFIRMEGSILRTLDVSFCALDEKGIVSLARSLSKRKRRGIAALRGLVLSGNHITYRAAKDLGMALAPNSSDLSRSRKRSKVLSNTRITGYEEDFESDDEDPDDDDADDFIGKFGRKRHAELKGKIEADGPCCSRDQGLQVLHLGSTSLTPQGLYQLLEGLGPHCPIKEFSIPSNKFGTSGASLLVSFLEAKGKASHPTMPFLDRLDLSNNELGNDGTAKLTRAVAKRVKNPFIDLRLSCNDIGHAGIETIMNKLLQHCIFSLSLDKNNIGDQGCQLVAASLQSMPSLSRLNLSFNQIGSRGVTTLMKALIACESITYLGLSGNIMKMSGAFAMGFTLAQHPRLEELDLDNCCLSQAAQCHIVAGIISNRWVPMKAMRGFQAGPPMVAICAIGVYAHNLSNEECFRIKRDEQMKTIRQWMNRAARENRPSSSNGSSGLNAEFSQEQFLTPDFVTTINDVHGTPSQNAYLRMLGWLSKIPFDEDELTSLRQYFYDTEGSDGDRGSDGYINLKLRGDLLAALDSGDADELRDQLPDFSHEYKGSVGFDLDQLETCPEVTRWTSIRGDAFDKSPVCEEVPNCTSQGCHDLPTSDNDSDFNFDVPSDVELDIRKQHNIQSSLSSLSRQSMMRSPSERSVRSARSAGSAITDRRSRLRARITMFPAFETKLEELKSTAKDLMEHETDPDQQDVILTQYAEASLTILRQLRYHCMNSGLDGWRQSGLRRKVLIVDDSLVTRKLVARAFEKANFIVDTAENGVEGVKKMKACIYDIAFMDIDMPVMNGFEATKALRQWEDTQRPGARQPICALTAAYVDDFERSELMKFKEAGLDVMESKPCNIPRLFKVVDDVSPMFSDLSISVSQASFNST